MKIVFRLERVIADTHYCFPGGNESRQILYKPRTANSAVYDSSLLGWLLVSLVKPFCFLFKTCVQMPAMPTIGPRLPTLPGASSGPAPPRLWDGSALPHPHTTWGGLGEHSEVLLRGGWAARTGRGWVAFHPRKKQPFWTDITFIRTCVYRDSFIYSLIHSAHIYKPLQGVHTAIRYQVVRGKPRPRKKNTRQRKWVGFVIVSVVRDGLIDWVTFERRPETGKGVNRAAT